MRRLIALPTVVVALAAGAVPASAHPRPTRVLPRLSVRGAFRVDHVGLDVPGRPVRLVGVVRPYVSRQSVTVRAYLGHRRLSTHRLRIHPLPGGRGGRFLATVTAPGAGRLHLEVTHGRSPRMLGFTVRTGLRITSTSTSDPAFTALVQQRLAARHVHVPRTGRWDLGTELAVDAYRRLIGHGPATTLDGATLTALLDGRGSFSVRYPRQGRHAEGDLSRQLLVLADGSRVAAIYPISSGKPSTPSILGSYQVYRRTPGYLPDGMYFSDFFIRGYAIHGYDPAPDYPASHGCLRLPITDAVGVFDWLALGDWVDVYAT